MNIGAALYWRKPAKIIKTFSPKIHANYFPRVTGSKITNDAQNLPLKFHFLFILSWTGVKDIFRITLTTSMSVAQGQYSEFQTSNSFLNMWSNNINKISSDDP